MPLSLQLLRNHLVALIALKRQLRDYIGFYRGSIGRMEKKMETAIMIRKWGTYNLASTKRGMTLVIDLAPLNLAMSLGSLNTTPMVSHRVVTLTS